MTHLIEQIAKDMAYFEARSEQRRQILDQQFKQMLADINRRYESRKDEKP